MYELFSKLVETINNVMYSYLLIIMLLGVGLYFTFRTKFVQRKIGTAIKLSVKPDNESEGNISPFAALTTTLSATVGTAVNTDDLLVTLG